jgi:ribose 5-phosphate isomerase
MKAAKQMVFIINERQFVGRLEGAVPVLIQQVHMLRSAVCLSTKSIVVLFWICGGNQASL